MESFEIIHPGALSTIQDLGRKRYQRFGMPRAGAMDITSLRMANRLAQNAEGEGSLDINSPAEAHEI